MYMLSDMRYALRTLARNPGFAAVAVLTLALGIGANTAIFSVFNAVLLHPLPYAEPGKLVAIEEVVPKFSRFGPSLPVTAWHFREWRKQSRAFEQFALVGDIGYTLTGGGDPLRLAGGRVSASLFPMLGIQARLGRTFREDEDQPGRDQVVVLSDSLWTRRFHRDPAIVGSRISLNGQPFEVIGVLPPAARIPSEDELSPLSRSRVEADLWKPFAIADSDLNIMAEFNYGCVARLKPGVSRAQAATDIDAIQAGMVKNLPEKTELRVLISPLQDAMTGGARQSLTLLLAAAGLVLLMVVVNLANLLLARASAQRRELAIRAAIGAGMGRIVRQLLTESLLLAAAGGALGALLANWALAGILVKAPLDLPGLKNVRLDSAALAFAALAAVGSGLLFAILPAWRMARTDPQAALKSGSLTITEGRQSGRLRRLLIAAEVALCSLCLVVGGLLLNSFVRLIHVDKGFRTDRALTLNLSLPASRYPDSQKLAAFVRALLDRIQSAPSVVAAGIGNRGPLSGEGSNFGMEVEDAVGAAAERPIVDYRSVTADFFRAMGIPLRGGRLFAPSDGDRKVGVISSLAARRVWPNADPIGKRFRLGPVGEEWIEVVGVVGDVRTSLRKAPNPTVYLPYWQLARPEIAVVVRTAAAPLAIAGALRGAIRDLDPELPAPRVRTIDDLVDGQLAERRFQLLLVLIFASSALLLASIGVYGVVSQTVARRTNEIGIRMALGASRADVRLMVARQGLAPVVAGLVAGLAAALAVARLAGGFLFDVRPTDPPTFAAVAVVLLAAAAAACYLPARRATRVDPLVALRYE
jgi:putative ABC transport system permease protein